MICSIIRVRLIKVEAFIHSMCHHEQDEVAVTLLVFLSSLREEKKYVESSEKMSVSQMIKVYSQMIHSFLI